MARECSWLGCQTGYRSEARPPLGHLAGLLDAVTTPGPLVWIMRPTTAYRITATIGGSGAVDVPTKHRAQLPLTAAITFAFMVGEWPPARLPGWVALGMYGEPTEADVWAHHRDALIAEAARHHFEPYWLDERAPSGLGFARWREAFLRAHVY